MRPDFINLRILPRPAEVLEIMSRVICRRHGAGGGGGVSPWERGHSKRTEAQEQTFAAGTEISMVS